MTHGVHGGEDHSIFTIDVDFPVAPLELSASATMADKSGSGGSR